MRLGRALDVARVERDDAVVAAADDPHGRAVDRDVGRQAPGGQALAVGRPRPARGSAARTAAGASSSTSITRPASDDRPARQPLQPAGGAR